MILAVVDSDRLTVGHCPNRNTVTVLISSIVTGFNRGGSIFEKTPIKLFFAIEFLDAR